MTTVPYSTLSSTSSIVTVQYLVRISNSLIAYKKKNVIRQLIGLIKESVISVNV